MSNAHPLVLAAADHVTVSNDEDGVAKAIRDFVLLSGNT
jgi:hydroxymethylpyrimidine pyrophosphatase-like HAD family hydrolase